MAGILNCNCVQAAASAADSDSEQSTLGGYASADGDAGGDDRATLWPLSRSRSRCGPAGLRRLRAQRCAKSSSRWCHAHSECHAILGRLSVTDKQSQTGLSLCQSSSVSIAFAMAPIILLRSCCRSCLHTPLALMSC